MKSFTFTMKATGQFRCRRRGDPDHRRARLPRDALAALPRPDGNEGARPRRKSPHARARPEAQGGNGASAADRDGFSIGSGSVTASSYTRLRTQKER